MFKVIFARNRTIRSFGSVIDVSPMGDYSELMPSGSVSERLGQYWEATDRLIGNSIEQESRGREHRRDITAA